VRHVNSLYLGARVLEMSDGDRIVCQRFLEEQRARERPM
jgi:hypothetical protein